MAAEVLSLTEESMYNVYAVQQSIMLNKRTAIKMRCKVTDVVLIDKRSQ